MRIRFMFMLIAVIIVSSGSWVLAIEEPTEDDEASALLDEARDLLEAGLYEEALDVYSVYIDTFPEDAQGYANRAQVHFLLLAFEDAYDDMATALDLAQSDNQRARYLSLRAEMSLQLREVDAAIADYEEALELDPEYTVALRNLGIVYHLLGDTEQAIEHFETALQIDPLDGETAVAASDMYLGLGEETEALLVLDGVVDAYLEADVTSTEDDPPLPPLFADVWIERGHIQGFLGNVPEQAEDYAAWLQAIAIDTITYDDEITETQELAMQQGTVYEIPFEARADEAVTALAVGDGVDAMMILLDPDGEALIGNDDASGTLHSFIESYPIPDDGTYTLLIGHARGGWDGSITLSFLLELDMDA